MSRISRALPFIRRTHQHIARKLREEFLGLIRHEDLIQPLVELIDHRPRCGGGNEGREPAIQVHVDALLFHRLIAGVRFQPLRRRNAQHAQTILVDLRGGELRIVTGEIERAEAMSLSESCARRKLTSTGLMPAACLYSAHITTPEVAETAYDALSPFCLR